MEVVEINSLIAVMRDVGVFAVLVVLSVYIVARSPFSLKITGTYSFSLGKNGYGKPERPDSQDQNPATG